jgi:hypothetical protein
MSRRLALLGACFILTGCEASFGPDKEGEAERGTAEANTLSLEAPGVDVKLDIPSIEKFATVEAGSDSDLLYPGSQLGALHIDARDNDGRVELRFTSSDSLDLVTRWYRDPGRSEHFTIESDRRDGSAHVLDGRSRDGGGRFRLRLEPNAGGGTAGRLVFAEG